MTDTLGLRMRQAILDLAPPAAAGLVAQARGWEATAAMPAALLSHQRILWASLGPAFAAGSLVAIGIPDGARVPERLDVHVLRNAAPDFDSDTLALASVRYAGVRVLVAPSAETGVAEQVSARSFADNDAPLLQRMRQLIEAGKAANTWEAAGLVASDARGRGTLESKQKRLARRFSELHR